MRPPPWTGPSQTFAAAGYNATRIPVSHAFHTSIVAPASEPLKAALRRLDVRPPRLPIVANVTGEFYPPDADVETMLDILGRQVASPVQFVKGLHTLYDAGARVFVEVGPKKALHGFAEDVLGAHDDVCALFTNHPKLGDVASFNQALCGLYAAGLGFPAAGPEVARPAVAAVEQRRPQRRPRAGRTVPAVPAASAPSTEDTSPGATMTGYAAADTITELGRLFADVLEQGLRIYQGQPGVRPAAAGDGRLPSEPVVITGAALGLPGVERVFDDGNIGRILSGEQFIDAIPRRVRQAMVDKHITRLVKRETGDPTFETIDSERDVIKLAGRNAPLDMVAEFGVEPERDAALDVTHPAGHRRGLRRAARRRNPAGDRTTGRRRSAPSCPTAGCCRSPCATTPASIFASAFPGSTPSPTT